MKSDKWANEGQYNDYFVSEPPVNEHPTFGTTNIFCAATMHLYGIEFLEFNPNGYQGRGEWVFANPNSAAFNLAREFRTAGAITVPVLEFQAAFRWASRQARMAREEDSYGQYRAE